MVKHVNHLNRYVAAVTTLGVVACGCVLWFGTHGAAHLSEVELIVRSAAGRWDVGRRFPMRG